MDKNDIFALLEKYNFWNGSLGNLGYQRNQYLDLFNPLPERVISSKYSSDNGGYERAIS
jgi:hypothetical protein